MCVCLYVCVYLEEDVFIVRDSKQICPLSQKNIFPLSFKDVAIQISLKRYSKKKSYYKKCRNVNTPWNTVSHLGDIFFIILFMHFHETLIGCYLAPEVFILSLFFKCSLCAFKFLYNYLDSFSWISLCIPVRFAMLNDSSIKQMLTEHFLCVRTDCTSNLGCKSKRERQSHFSPGGDAK